jgi:hypothetical protein
MDLDSRRSARCAAASAYGHVPASLRCEQLLYRHLTGEAVERSGVHGSPCSRDDLDLRRALRRRRSSHRRGDEKRTE